MPLIQCTYGPVTTEVSGSQYTFEPDEFGRCVAEVWDPKHIKQLTAVIHYRLVPDEPEPLVLTSIEPSEAVIGGPDITLIATGTGFLSDCSIVFNGAAEATDFRSSTQLSTIVRPLAASEPKSVPVLIRDVLGAESGALDFTFTEPVASSLPGAEEPPVDEAPAGAVADPGEQPVSVISGIGAATETKLNGAGISTVRQLAELTPDDAAALDDRLGLAGRTSGWVESAKALIA